MSLKETVTEPVPHKVLSLYQYETANICGVDMLVKIKISKKEIIKAKILKIVEENIYV